MDVSLITYTVADMAEAKQFFGALIGAEPYADSPQYVGYRSGDVEIGLVPSRGKGEPVAIPYWSVDDIAKSVQALVAAGGTIVQDVTDVGYGLLVASLKEPSGSMVGLRRMPKG